MKFIQKLENKFLHIISLDVPYPVDYGGAIDIFYRIQALHELGYKIILHCWEYGRGEQEKLNEITHHVYYYQRKKPPLYVLNKLPFIVISRQSDALFNNLLGDTHPILFEGIHTTLLLDNTRLKDRMKIVRMHNVEHDYYSALSEKSSGWKKWFYKKEAKKLKEFQPILNHANWILAIQKKDQNYFETFHPNVKLLPASVPPIISAENIETQPYCLFHGNLSVQENDSAANWILNNIASSDINIIIAGKNPSSDLKSLALKKEVQIISNPSEGEMQKLVSEARVHLLYTEQATGIKLKLINALSSGGHVLVNSTMLEGTELNNECVVFENVEDCKIKLKALLEKTLSATELNSRIVKLQTQFNTYNNCQKVFGEILS